MPRHFPAKAGIALLGALALLVASSQRAAVAQLPSETQVAPQGNRIVAVVNGEVVSRADVIGRARLFALNARIAVAPDMLERLTPQVTLLLVDEKLRLQEVQRRRLPVTDAEIADAV